jgi:hypothetical protein
MRKKGYQRAVRTGESEGNERAIDLLLREAEPVDVFLKIRRVIGFANREMRTPIL